MCFSAGASFGAAAVLGITGIVSLRRVTSRSEIAFSTLPLLFGMQQFAEGLLWLALGKDGYEEWKEPAIYFFLFFAQFLWPIYVPFSILLLERDQKRKNIIYFIVAAGVITSFMLIYRLFNYNVDAEILGHHIHYAIESPKMIIVMSSILYVIAIILPGFISKIKGMKTMALCIAVMLVITKIFYEVYLISVWCFFAAILSVIILWIMKKLHEEEGLRIRNLQHKMGLH